MAQQPHGIQPVTFVIRIFQTKRRGRTGVHKGHVRKPQRGLLNEPNECKPLDELRSKLSACDSGGTKQTSAEQKEAAGLGGDRCA